MAPVDPCLEFMTSHLPSGTWHSADGSLPPAEFRDAPYVPGLRMVYGDAIQSAEMQDLLLTEQAPQRSAMVYQPRSGHGATLDTNGALALANQVRMTLKLPNTGQLDLDHPSIHPIDERGQAADPATATHAFVLSDNPLRDLGAGPFTSDAHRVFSGMMKSSPAALRQLPAGDPMRDAYDQFMGMSYGDLQALPEDHPLRQAVADPEGFVSMLPATGDGITQESVNRSFGEFQDRLGMYDAFWNDPDIRFAFLGYKRQLTFEFYQRQVLGQAKDAYATSKDPAKGATDENEAKALKAAHDARAAKAANDAIAASVNARFGGSLVPRFAQLMADAGALSVPHEQWLKAQGEARDGKLDFGQWLNERRDYYRNRLALWGKLNPAVADRIAREQDQRILESTPLGAIADDILFGLPRYDDGTPGYFEFWRLASHHLVEVSGGEIEAHVFEGVMRGGVLDSTEVPAVLEKIAKGQISSLKITVWKLFGTVLAPMADIYIRSQKSYDANAPIRDPKTQPKEYWDQQDRLYMQKVYRSEEMARLGYRNSFSDMIQSVDGPPRRGAMDRDHPIFVLLNQELDGMLQDGNRPKERSNSQYMTDLIEQIRNRPSPARSPQVSTGLQRVPTGALDTWGNNDLFERPALQRSGTTQYSPTDEAPRRPSNSSAGSTSPLESISETAFERTAFPLEHINGLVVGDQALVDRVTATNPRFAPDEYPIFMHGALLGGPDGLQDAITDVLDGLARDSARADGKKIVLVVCVVAVGPERLNDAAAAFFNRLPATYPKLTVFPTATLMPRNPEATPDDLSEVHSFQTALRTDGTFGLTANLIRTYTDAPEAPPATGGRPPMIQLHPPALSLARGEGVPVTDRSGRPLPLTDDLAGQLRALGQNGQIMADVPGSITFMYPYGRGHYPPAQLQHPPPPRVDWDAAYRDVLKYTPSEILQRPLGHPLRDAFDGYTRRSSTEIRRLPPDHPLQLALADWTPVYREMMRTPPALIPLSGPLRDAFNRFSNMSYAGIRGLPSSDPMREAFADPGGSISRLPATGDGITQSSVRGSFHQFQSRLAMYDAFWYNPEIRFAFLDYKRQLTYEFELKQSGATNAAIQAEVETRFGTDVVSRFVQLMADAGALSIPHGEWLDNQSRPDFAQWLAGRRAFYWDKLALWGKLNPAVADRIAQQRSQRILESTPLGAIADDILFGLPNYDMGTPGYFEFWRLASHHLVNLSGGRVEAHVFEGVMRRGVLERTEIPVLLDKIESGEIDSLKITIWKLRGQVVVHSADIFVHSRESYVRDALMLDPDTVSEDYKAQQGRLYLQKIYRSREMADRGYLNSITPMVQPVSGSTGRRGAVDMVHPIFVLNEIKADVEGIMADQGGRRRSSQYMESLIQQIRNRPSPAGSQSSQDGLPFDFPTRAPTGAADWSDYGFTPGPSQRVNSSNFGPLDDRRSSASSSVGPARRPSATPSARRASVVYYDEPDDLSGPFGQMAIGGRFGSQSYPPVSGSRSRPPRSASNAGIFTIPKDSEFSARAGELTGDAVHENPAEQAEKLPDRPGTLLFGQDHAPRAAIDRNLKLLYGTYQFSMEGVAGAGVLDGQKVNAEQVRDMILADERSHDLDLTLVQCEPAFPVTDALDSFLVDLWKLLIADGRWNPRRSIFGSVGGVKAQISPNGRGDALALSDTIAPDGSIRLNTGGFRSITMHPDAPAGAVVPLLRQHGTTLSEAVNEGRAGGGIPLTNADGDLLTLPRAAFLGKGLNDPVHLERAAEHQNLPNRDGEQTTAPAPTWDIWMPGNVKQVSPNVYVASSHPIPQTAEAKAYYAALEKNATDANPIVDVGVGRDRTVLPQDADSARLMMLQLANRDRQAFLATRDRPTNELLAMTTPYGAPLFHQTLAAGDLGGLNLGPRFTFTLPRTEGRTQLPSVITEGLTAGLFAKARELAQPTSAIKPIDDKLGQVIWAADLAKSRDQFQNAGWSSDEMTQHLGEVSAMSERVGNLPKIAIVKPALEWGALGHADLVFDYGLTEETQRAGKMMDSLGEMQAAGKLGTDAPDALTIGQFSSLAAAAGTRDLSVPALGVIDAALQDGDIDTALRAFNRYADKFTVEQKTNLVSGLERLKTKLPPQIIQRAMQAVLDC